MNSDRLKGLLSSSSQLVAASAQLAKKQAELATLNNVTLPRLYHAIGKRLIGSSNLPPDLVPHRERIWDLEAAIAKKPEERTSEPAAGFAAKAKQLAQQAASRTAKATTDAAATVRIQAAYVALGKQAIAKYGPTALPTDLQDQYQAGIQKQTDLGSDIAALKGDSRKGFFTPQRLLFAAMGLAIVVVGSLFVPRWAAPRGNTSHLRGSDTSATEDSSESEKDRRLAEYMQRPTQYGDAAQATAGDLTDVPRLAPHEAAKIVRSHMPTAHLEVADVRAMSVGAARLFASCPANLSFPDLEILDEDVALALLNNRGATVSNSGMRANPGIYFGNIRELSPRAAFCLSRGKWKWIHLRFAPNVTISDEAAMGLAMFRGELAIDGGDLDFMGQNAIGAGPGGLAWIVGPSVLYSPAFTKKLCESARRSQSTVILGCRGIKKEAAEALCKHAVGLRVQMLNIEGMGEDVARQLLLAHDKGVEVVVDGPLGPTATGAVKRLFEKCGER